MQTQHQMTGRYRRSRNAIGRRQHVLDDAHAALDRFRGAADVLHVVARKPIAFLQTLGAEQRRDLIRLAAEADEDRRCDVRMPRVARHRPAQHVHAFAHVHAAAGAVRQRDHAVDVRISGEHVGTNVGAELIGDRTRHRCRAVDARDDRDVVARRDAAVVAHDAHEGRRRIDHCGRLYVGAERVVARCAADVGTVLAADSHVVQMDVLAGANVARRKADDLVVAAHRRAGRNRARRELVARRDQTDHSHAFVLDQRARHELTARDDDVIGGVQSQYERHFLQHSFPSSTSPAAAATG